MSWLLAFVGIVCGVALLYWCLVMSIRIVGPNQRGVRKSWGKLETAKFPVPGKTEPEDGLVLLPPGKYFRPWIPNWIYGYQPYDLVLIPTDEFKVAWGKTDLENFWTANGIRITQVQVNSIQSLPWDDPVAMLRAYRANVPMQAKDYSDGREGLQSWEKQPVMAQVRIAVRKKPHDYFTGSCNEGVSPVPPDFTEITNEVNAALRGEKSPLLRAGIFGTVVEDVNPGKGNLDVSIEAVEVEKSFRAKLQGVVTAPMDVKIARHQAKASAALFDDTNQALKAYLEEQCAAGNNPTKDEIKAKQAEFEARAKLKAPGYQELHIKGLENATTAVVGGGGGSTGILVGGGNPGGKKNPGGNPGGQGKRVQDMTDDEINALSAADLRKLMKGS
jgi:hypothetical protein